MKIQRKHVLVAAGVVLVGAVAFWALRPEAVSVQTGVVDRGPLRVTVDEDGETRVRDRYLVSAPVTGRMERLTCEAGDSVTEGEVLARIFPLPLDTRSGRAAAERLDVAEANANAARAREELAEAQWSEARRALERLERVAAQVPGAVTAQRLDRASTAERSANLAVEEARAGVTAAAHELEAARAALLGSGEVKGEPTRVRAPASGRILRVYEECERVVTAGAPIVEVGDPGALEVVVDVLTEDAALLRPGAPAYVVPGPSADSLAGVIDRISPSAFTKVSPLGVEEQRVDVVVRFQDDGVVLGDRYRVAVALVAWEGLDVLRVPVSALFRAGDDWAVFVVDAGRAHRRVLTIGERNRRSAAVEDGLREGDEVVIYPSDAVEDGIRVRREG
ncbi:MAG: efflux RND transporter periplasmic adaptor subunit [Gemmatimonadota bacterium]